MGILIAYLLGIMSAILPKGTNRKNEKSETGDESRKPQPSAYPERVSTEINLSPKEAERYYSEEDKAHTLQYRIFWVNFITLLALTLYTFFTYHILCATQKSANAAKSAADTAAQTMRLDERAWVVAIHDPIAVRLGNPLSITGHFEIRGKTPAIKIETCIAATVLGQDDIIEFSYEPHTGHPCTKHVISYSFPDSTPPTFSATVFKNGTKTGELVSFNKGVIKEIQAGKTLIVMHGKITYFDIFGTQHWSKFCSFYPDSLAMGQLLHRLPTDCLAYNELDKNK